MTTMPYYSDMDGSTEEEKKAAEEIVDTTEETWDRMSRFFWEKDEAKKVKRRVREEMYSCLQLSHRPNS